jgi:hypothetical protein
MAGGLSFEGLDSSLDMLANVDVHGNPIACARFFGGREYATLTANVEGENNTTTEAALRVIAAGSYALPSFCASQGPFPSAQGITIRPPTKPDEMHALGSLYCALVTDVCLDNLGVTGDLVIEGRYAKDKCFVEALAHFRPNQALSISDDLTGTIQGAMRLLNWPDSPATPLTPFRTRDGEGHAFRKYHESWRAQLPQ